MRALKLVFCGIAQKGIFALSLQRDKRLGLGPSSTRSPSPTTPATTPHQQTANL
jgi:hypothetical protein